MKYGWKFIKSSAWLFFDAVRSGIEQIHGAYAITKLQQPIVTIFGGMRAKLNDPFAQQAYQMARLLVEHKITVLTGGGPGIMEAANCGAASVAQDKGLKATDTLGIAVLGVDEDFDNPCSELYKVRHFFVRKNLLIRYSIGFIVFPGGIGTMDELFEVLNLLKHHRIPPLPVVLIGKEYWSPLLAWFNDSALEGGFIKPEYLEFFTVTDDLNVALERVQAFNNRLR